jgi:2-polyprenyl-3-methyl-5-hydroxy-6-metoxy-1,4-benzoquinol methylase
VIERWSEGTADDNMAEQILVELSDLVRRHPWWKARTSLTLSLLGRLGVTPPARVLDAGCGWGVTLDAIEGRGYHCVGMDVSRRALERIDRPGRTLVEADLSKTIPVPHHVPRFDAVLALDVIEHIDDDRCAIERLGVLARPEGVVIISVPALAELYGLFDSIQGHRRRYSPETLQSAFVGTGLIIERLFWWGSWLVPMLRRQRASIHSQFGDSPAEVYRRYLKLPPIPLPWLARMAFALEQPKAVRGQLRTGTSLFAIARPVSS